MTDTTKSRWQGFAAAIVPSLVTLLVLSVLAVDRAVLDKPSPKARSYHQRVQAAVEQMPYVIDGWVGEDADVPPAAVRLLRPNAILSRTYRDPQTGREATVVVVHCSDARDLLGHYPPVCYVANGWALRGRQPADWQVDAGAVHGMTYEFSRETIEDFRRIVIANFMVLPNGTIVRDMDDVNRTAQNRTQKHLGAAQFQILVSARMSEADRREVVRTLVEGNWPIIEIIRKGIDE